MKKYDLFYGNCFEFIKTMDVKTVIVSDVPYPDYLPEEYGYFDGILEFLNGFDCRQFIFWSAKVDFPLSYTAIHIWDKKTGAGSEYERIFERNGNKNYKVFRHYLINSTVAASFTGDVFINHPSQKPKQLMLNLLLYGSKSGETIFDPFMGSGTTGVACMQLGRNFIGCENNKKYFSIADKRISQAAQNTPMFTDV